MVILTPFFSFCGFAYYFPRRSNDEKDGKEKIVWSLAMERKKE